MSLHPQGAPSTALGAGSAVLGFDVGGTDVKGALVDASGTILALERRATPRAGNETADAIVAAVASFAEALRSKYPHVTPNAIGFLVPGHVDEEAGVGIYSENLGWHDYPFRDKVEVASRLPVAFGHDVRGAGEAERRLGAAAPFRDVVVVTIGTGISSAIFVDGRAYAGGGLAGEIGHTRVADGPDCSCGRRGCLEAVASAAAIARRYTALTGTAVHGAKEVVGLAQAGDPAAVMVWQSALDALALGLSQVVALLAPEAIVLGGGLSQAGATLFEPLEQKLESILTFQRRPQLLPASIGENAGVIGAALMARARFAKGSARGVTA